MGAAHPVCGHHHFVTQVTLVRDAQAQHLVGNPGVNRELAEADDHERRQDNNGEDQNEPGLPRGKFGALWRAEDEEADKESCTEWRVDSRKKEFVKKMPLSIRQFFCRNEASQLYTWYVQL